MPATEVENNTASESASTGSGPFTLGAALNYNRSIQSIVPDAELRTYFAYDPDGTKYMQFRGVLTGTSLAVSEVVTSSAGGTTLESFDGTVIYISVVAGKEEIEGDETEVTDLDPAVLDPTGYIDKDSVVLLPGLQDGIAKAFGPESLNPNPLVLAQGFDRKEIRHFTDFANAEPTASYVLADAGKNYGQEPWRMNFGHTTSTATIKSNKTFTSQIGVVSLEAEDSTLDWASISHVAEPIILDPDDSSVYFGCRIKLDAVIAVTTNEFIIFAGFFPVGLLPTNGMYIYASYGEAAAPGNWYGRVVNGATPTVTNTGVAQTTNWVTLEMIYDPVAQETRFYVDGALSGTPIPTATRFPAATGLQAAIEIGRGVGSQPVGTIHIDACHFRVRQDDGVSPEGYSTGLL